MSANLPQSLDVANQLARDYPQMKRYQRDRLTACALAFITGVRTQKSPCDFLDLACLLMYLSVAGYVI